MSPERRQFRSTTVLNVSKCSLSYVSTFIPPCLTDQRNFGIYVALRPRRRDDLLGTGTEWERGQGNWLDRGNRPKKTGETVDPRRCPLAIAQRLVHCAIALSTAVLDRVTKTMSVAPLLTNNLDNSKQKTSNLLSPAPPPYS